MYEDRSVPLAREFKGQVGEIGKNNCLASEEWELLR